MSAYVRAAMGAWLCCLILSSSAKTSPAPLVAQYLDDFNDRIPAKNLVARYWHTPMTVYAGGVTTLLQEPGDVEAWLADIQQRIADDGWLRSETTSMATCLTDARTALHAIRFVRHYDDGRALPGAGIYLLIYTEQWRIAGIILADPDHPLPCIP